MNHDAAVTALDSVIVDNELILVSAGMDGKVCLWDYNTRQQLGGPMALCATGPVLGLSVLELADGPVIGAVCADGAIRLTPLKTGEIGATITGSSDAARLTAIAPIMAGGANVLVCGDNHGNVRYCDPIAGRLDVQSSFERVTAAPIAHLAAANIEGPTVVAADAAGMAWWWNAETGKSLGEIPITNRGLISAICVWSQTLIAAGRDGAILRWSLIEGMAIGSRLTGHRGQVNALAVSSYSRRDAIGFGSVVIDVHDRRTHRLAVVSGGEDGKVRFWDVISGEVIRSIQRASGQSVTALHAVPERFVVVSGAADGALDLLNEPTFTDVYPHIGLAVDPEVKEFFSSRAAEPMPSAAMPQSQISSQPLRIGIGWSTYFNRGLASFLYPKLRFAYRSPAFFAGEIINAGVDIDFTVFDDRLLLEDMDDSGVKRADSVDILYLCTHGEQKDSGEYVVDLCARDWTPFLSGMGDRGPRVAVFDTCYLVKASQLRGRNDPPQWAQHPLGLALRLVLGFASPAIIERDQSVRGYAFAENLSSGQPIAQAWLDAVKKNRFKDTEVAYAIAFGDDTADAERVCNTATLGTLPPPRLARVPAVFWKTFPE